MPKQYKIINILLAGIFGMVFLYSSFFSSDGSGYPIACQYEKAYHKECPSCGLSRAFSEIMRGKWQEAKYFNNYSLKVFLFFAVQFIARLGLSVSCFKTRYWKNIILCDTVLSTFYFIYTFYQFAPWS